jgi:hypothetical protein
MEATEDKLTAAEFRAQAAEAEALEAKQSRALVEEPIRRRLLCATPAAIGELSAVACDLPLKFHPVAIRVSADVTPFGAR